ncbi:MAG: hypothetical protein A2559_07715 [Deltaproteobacteria bacterium RIFOXYD2_FULL_66_9]|nr:MAG: hypothetical protein A2559_07715 [Deltaproteobacteria bacterium RIFOXYD2_FULL_66_9]
MRILGFCPMTSIRSYPVIRSKAGLTYWIAPRVSVTTMLSPACSTAIVSLARDSSTALASVTSVRIDMIP